MMTRRKARRSAGWLFVGLYAAALIVAFALVAHARTTVNSEDPLTLFVQANQAYSSGNFTQARDLYLHLLTLTPNNATVEYNLGNTYARLGDTALSVLHYERALQSNPRLSDARQNLLQVAPPANHPDVSPLILPFRWVKRLMNVNEWLWATFLFLLAACLSAALWALDFKFPVFWKRLSIVVAVLFLVSAAFTTSTISDAVQPRGVVLHDKTMARSGPGENYLEAMELPAGTKVVAAGEPQRGWVKIRTPDGHAAYVQSGDVEWI